MIRILILIAIVGLTTLLGAMLTKSRKKRMKVFSELYEFNERLILNMKFDKNPISSIASEFEYIPDILAGKSVLNGKDNELISDYAVNLGKSDALSQIDYLNGRRDSLSKYRNDSSDDYKRYGSLYVKIFFMIGVLAAVLLA